MVSVSSKSTEQIMKLLPGEAGRNRVQLIKEKIEEE
jgi:hypothetical protein